MISKENLKYVQIAIKEFDKYVDKNYLFVFRTNKKHPVEILEITLKEKHFWHLVGCKLNTYTQNNIEKKHEIYVKCKQGEDISEFLDYTDKSSDVKIKSENLSKQLKVINNAIDFRITNTDNTPDSYIFKIAIGHENGILGYSKEDKSFFYYPKTSQNKSIFNIKKNVNQKIEVVLSKFIKENCYSCIEYEYKKDFSFKDIVNNLIEKHIPLSKELKDINKNNISKMTIKDIKGQDENLTIELEEYQEEDYLGK